MLPRAARLRKERDFRAVFARKPLSSQTEQTKPRLLRVQSTQNIALHIRPIVRRMAVGGRSNEDALIRFGITVGKKVAKRAHDRNKIKRRLSEIARTEVLPRYVGGLRVDCVIVAKPAAIEADFATLRADLLEMIDRSRLELRHGSDTED